jgi:hypothetical protein
LQRRAAPLREVHLDRCPPKSCSWSASNHLRQNPNTALPGRFMPDVIRVT